MRKVILPFFYLPFPLFLRCRTHRIRAFSAVIVRHPIVARFVFWAGGSRAVGLRYTFSYR